MTINYQCSQIMDIITNVDADKINNINACDDHGRTALMYVCILPFKDNDIIAQKLINQGASLDMKDIEGNTALIHACNLSNDKIVKLLIENGADLNLQNNMGHTALLVCLNVYSNKNKNITTIKLLVDAGTDVNICDVTKWTPLLVACRYGQGKIRNYLINMFIKAGADIFFQNDKGWTPLMIIIRNSTGSYNSEDIIDTMIKMGSDLNAYTFDEKLTAFMIALAFGSTKTINLFIANGANPHMLDIENNIPINYLILRKPNLEFKDCLIKMIQISKNSLTIKNNKGNTAYCIYNLLKLDILNPDELLLLKN